MPQTFFHQGANTAHLALITVGITKLQKAHRRFMVNGN